jgi:hypothetical protein
MNKLLIILPIIIFLFMFKPIKESFSSNNSSNFNYKIKPDMLERENWYKASVPNVEDNKYFNPKQTVINFNCLPATLDETPDRCLLYSKFMQNTNAIFDKGTTLRNFRDYGSPSEKECLKKAKQVCGIRSIPSSTCFNHQYRNTLLQQFPRDGELLGNYIQEPNNQLPFTKCDCSNRAFDMCPVGEKVSKKCLYNAMKICLSK